MITTCRSPAKEDLWFAVSASVPGSDEVTAKIEEADVREAWPAYASELGGSEQAALGTRRGRVPRDPVCVGRAGVGTIGASSGGPASGRPFKPG